VNGVILPIIAVALLFAQALTAVGIPQLFVETLTSITTDPIALTMIMLLIFTIAGMFMETTPNIVILGPLLLPVAQKIGMDPVHFCVFMVTALGFGFITPPMGLNLFVVSGLTGTPIMSVARAALPFVLAMVVVTILVAFVPDLSLWLLRRG